jgi:nicotinamidase-related amidase
MGRKALLVIDLQQDFLPGGALAAAPGSERIVPVVNKLLDASVFDLRVASTDWHPEVCRQPCLHNCCNQHVGGSACACLQSAYAATYLAHYRLHR